jgi:hypothetical protein
MKTIKILFLIFIPLLIACKHDEQLPSNQKVEFILLDSYETKMGSKAILKNSIVLNDSSLIEYAGISTYDSETYRFFLTAEAKQALIDFGPERLHGKAFALTINRKAVYTGYFWALFSSSICDWVYIDPLMFPETDFLEVKLGYPWYSPEMQIPDDRNNEELLKILEKDGKLQ